MRKILLLLFLGAFLLAVSPDAFAHGSGAGKVDAPTYVRQAIAFLEGTNNAEAAEERVQDALILQSDEVNPELLRKAQQALKNSNLEEAKALLVKALGKEPAEAEELALRTGFKGSLVNYAALFLGAIFIVSGVLIIRKKTPAVRKEGGIIGG
ncbi:MAG: hypothetical protein JG764_36 [Clostridiales bacterium]|jgi:hypothetical protein|nr:hypothetical protein [Clostridiales bacterium]